MFVGNIQSLTSLVEKHMSQLDGQVNRIEAEKLRAVGLRNRVATLEEVRVVSGGGGGGGGGEPH